jgi:RNA polymerase sigma-70 factor (ECF subfamily)
MTLTDLYEEYEAPLRSYAARLARDRDRADDLVQETFLRAMNHVDLLALLEPHQRRAWLYRTLKNLFLDQEDARYRQEALVERLAWDVPAAGYRPHETISPNPFDLVPEHYRELFKMRYVWGMNSTEIAEQLGVPAATVRSRLHLALVKLRSQAWKLE